MGRTRNRSGYGRSEAEENSKKNKSKKYTQEDGEKKKCTRNIVKELAKAQSAKRNKKQKCNQGGGFSEI